LINFIDANVVAGLVVGCIYAIAASGLVMAYNTSGVLNLGYGAIAYAIALIFYELRSAHHILSGVEALVLCVVVVGPLLGILLWQGLFRWLVGLGLLPTLIASIGIAVALPALCEMVFAPGQVFYSAGVSDAGTTLHRIGGIIFTVDQAYAAGAAVVVGVLLLYLLRFTRIGLKMRAVSDSRTVAGLTGTSPGMTSNLSWAISGALAAIGGVFLAPLLALTPAAFLTLTVASLAAALAGGLRSIGITFAAALAIGMVSSSLVGLNSTSELLTKGVQPSLPFLVMVAAVLIRRNPIDVGQLPRRTVELAERFDPLPAIAWRVAPATVLVLLAPAFLSDYWLGVVGLGLIYGIIFLGFTLAQGYGGLLPLGQAAIVGIAAFSGTDLAASAGVPLLIAVLLGALITTVVAVALATIGSRLSALEFGLLTIAFGLFTDNFLYNWTALVPLSGRSVGSPSLFGLSLASTVRQYYLFAVALGLVAVGIGLYRRRLGAFYIGAGRMKPTLAAATGVDPRLGRTIAFALAAFTAGLGGGLLAIYQKFLSSTDLTTTTGLTWLAVVVFMGIRSPAAAVAGGLVYAIFPALLSQWLPIQWGPLATVMFGLGALSLAQNPRGAVAAQVDQARAVARKVRPLFVRARVT
jgi:branched-chain amino acid transport system permease protein